MLGPDTPQYGLAGCSVTAARPLEPYVLRSVDEDDVIEYPLE